MRAVTASANHAQILHGTVAGIDKFLEKKYKDNIPDHHIRLQILQRRVEWRVS